ncbi:MAG TPA: ATP-binding protein [Planctomycetota bacterium]|nr:ATP-binding protein [Planctomycetota bacterium]
MTPPRAVLAWSGGKDSAWALHLVRQSGEAEVAGLLTALAEADGRVTLHGVPEELAAAQAAALGLPLRTMRIPSPCSDAEYAARVAAALESARADGVTHVIYGDLYLESVRPERERQAAAAGLTPLFPLWHRGTALTAEAMILGGLRARVVSVDLAKLPREFCGREYDEDFVCDLPAGVDPCGENGEFHTFCHAGPMFGSPVAFAAGAVVERDGFAWAELSAPPRCP